MCVGICMYRRMYDDVSVCGPARTAEARLCCAINYMSFRFTLENLRLFCLLLNSKHFTLVLPSTASPHRSMQGSHTSQALHARGVHAVVSLAIFQGKSLAIVSTLDRKKDVEPSRLLRCILPSIHSSSPSFSSP